MLDPGVILRGDGEALEMNIGRAAKPESDYPRRRRGVGDPIDQNKSADRRIFLIWVEGNRRGRGEIAKTDFVETQGFRCELAERIDIETMLEPGHRDRNGPSARLHEIGAARQELAIAHPNEMRGELIGDLGPVFRIAQNIAARDIELIGQSERDRIAGRCALKVAIGGDDARDPREAAGTRDGDFVAWM